jgi:hypothetical protein
MKNSLYYLSSFLIIFNIQSQEIVDQTLNTQVDANIPGVVAQKEIDNLDEKAKKLYYEFKDTVSEYEGLKSSILYSHCWPPLHLDDRCGCHYNWRPTCLSTDSA